MLSERASGDGVWFPPRYTLHELYGVKGQSVSESTSILPRVKISSRSLGFNSSALELSENQSGSTETLLSFTKEPGARQVSLYDPGVFAISTETGMKGIFTIRPIGVRRVIERFDALLQFR